MNDDRPDTLRSQLDHADRVLASTCDALLGPPLGDRRVNIDDMPNIARALRAERDRLRATIEAAREFSAAHKAWIAKARGPGVTSVDEESRRRAATLAALVGLVDQLDADGEDT